MKHNRFIPLLLAILLACSSCSAGTGNKETQPDNASTSEAKTETVVETSLVDTLSLGNYDGASFTILLPSQHSYEFAEETTGEGVNDAVYGRDLEVETRLKIDLNYLTESGDWAGKDTYNARITNSVMASDGEFDLVDGMIAVVLPTSTMGVFMDLTSLAGMSFDDPWWAVDFYENMNIANKLYGIVGSSLLSDYKSSYAMYANMQLIEDRNLADPISLVLEGKWTLDSMLSLALDQSADLDNNGKYDGNDFYGIVNWDVPLRALQTATEIAFIGRDADGRLISNGLTERVADVVSKCGDMFSKSSHHAYTFNDDVSETYKPFANNQSILYSGTIGQIEYLRDMESDFAILPFPKYDESQSNYYTQVATGSGMWFIPQTTPNAAMVTDFMNLHGALSLTDVVPIYFEEALKSKYVRDERNAEVVNIIINTLSSRLDFLYASSLGVNTNTLLYTMLVEDKAPASTVSAIESKLQTALDNLYDTFDTMES